VRFGEIKTRKFLIERVVFNLEMVQRNIEPIIFRSFSKNGTMALSISKHNDIQNKDTQHDRLVCDIKHKCTLRINDTKQKTSQYKNTLNQVP
jgi:hypothetical protein